MKIFAALFFAATVFNVAAQIPEVPHKMTFAGMTLTIRDDARREIQKDVTALTQSPKHFNIKAERAKTYFPIVEKIFAEEGVPEDFKYLVLQESSLVPDAVSVSNAVGFWQFKDFTAIEMGLRVDKEIDERMNIASSSRAAARYIKKNNVSFDNWLYALQAYQMGAGGVSRSLKKPHNGEKHAEITSDTYWYIRKFLAHKIAFENCCGTPGLTTVTVYECKSHKTLAEISKEFAVDETELRNFNKWSKSGVVPNDRSYVVLIPGVTSTALASVDREDVSEKRVEPSPSVKAFLVKKKINGVTAIEASQGETAAKLAARANVDLADLLKWNEMSNSAGITGGEYYFIGKKRAKGSIDYHTLAKGETLWQVSQKYGVRLKKIMNYNRLKSETVSAGTVLWLSSKKPKDAEKPVTEGVVVEVSNSETFNWGDEQHPQANPSLIGSPTASADTSHIIIEPVRSRPAPVPVVLSNSSADEKVAEEPVTDVASNQTLENVTDSVSQTPSDSIAPIIVEPTSAPVVAKKDHVVQVKETLYGIAKIYGVGVMDLVNWNGLDLQQGIKPGQILKVSEPQQITTNATPSKEDSVHEVKASDTLYSIARKYGVTIKDLMEWNNKKDFSVSVGEKLTIKWVP